MTPSPGARIRRFVGDRVRFALQDRDGRRPVKGWRALLRTNLGRAEMLRREIIQAHTRGLAPAGASWRDVPMAERANGWELELPLAEVGYFKAKAYLLDPQGWQHWPEGPDIGLAVHPDRYRTGNTIYCAFTRMFGATRTAANTRDEKQERTLSALDQGGYTVIPPSGKLRDLVACLPHIMDILGCRILHLLPVHPTPTTYARFGRFGSPYAALDLTAIDPALVVFDKRTTGIDQFRELTYAAHLRGGRVFLDIVINHTGWGSVLQECHPEWFAREPDGRFVSPGAWGNTWEDLVELKHRNVALWDKLAEMFLTWCRRGVDGFRCDAGYKVPVAAWQYIIARVQQEYPETLFLLEGLGGAWETTEALLTEGGMQWAYSELFQNYSGVQVSGYLDHSFRQGDRVGLLVHYSETHDNERLAAKGRAWSLLRNRLCALASESGGFGFTCGVEWLASEKIRVHGSTGMAWGSPENIVPEMTQLDALLKEHPCFFDGAKLTRLSPPGAPVYALRRESAEGKDTVLVLINTDVDQPQSLVLTSEAPRPARGRALQEAGLGADPDLPRWLDLLGQVPPKMSARPVGQLTLTLGPGAAYCLAPALQPRGLHGGDYPRARAQAAWGLRALHQVLPVEQIGEMDWTTLAQEVSRSPAQFLAVISHLARQFEAREQHRGAAASAVPLGQALARAAREEVFPCVVEWTLVDGRRITLVPPGHWLLVQDTTPFRAALTVNDGTLTINVESIAVQQGHVAVFPPRAAGAEGILRLERYSETDSNVEAGVRFLSPEPEVSFSAEISAAGGHGPRATDLVLLTNGRGAMARLCVDLGRVNSKYDCVLGANLHPMLPVDRHVFVKRIRVWVNADGFISPLDFQALFRFEPGPPAVWDFIANAGDGRTVEIQVQASMLPDRNTTVFYFSRPTAEAATGKQLPADADVRLTVRFDIEDRGYHGETRRNGGADYHFTTNVHTLGPEAGLGRQGLETKTGFAFTPASDRRLRVFANQGAYHPQPEWSENILHPVEQSRGQVGSGDAFSPGWFDLPMPKGATATVVVTADATDPAPVDLARSKGPSGPSDNAFGLQLLRAAQSFVVRRDSGKTVIAGYPWFLDWGRDTFISARGLLSAGLVEEVRQMLVTFARFEKNGTLPNTIFGEDASNRDTSDAPLWFGVVCEELATLEQTVERTPAGSSRPAALYETHVDNSGRTLRAVLESIARHYIQGTPNGIRMDPASSLIWSPSHFTWMDTNYPACTAREGYPVEIQALWIRLLHQLAHLAGANDGKRWQSLADQALDSVEKRYWLEHKGYYSDLLIGGRDKAAAAATVDDALRSNFLFLVSLGLVTGERAKRCVAAAARYLVVPGGLRSLAPLPISVALPNCGSDGRLLNDPHQPYWGRYEGDEDTRRKPAYHNGTAWTWTFPVFCEALARAWSGTPEGVAAARAYLGSSARLLTEGCLGQLPEILDGDTPHMARGCDAQAWSATEALRVWKLLQS